MKQENIIREQRKEMEQGKELKKRQESDNITKLVKSAYSLKMKDASVFRIET